MVSPKELKKVKQEKEYLVIQLSESHVLIDSLKSQNTMLLNTINELENKLEKFSRVDDLSTSTSNDSDSELDSIDMKPVIEDTAWLDNFCLTNHAMPKSKES
jgi:hypothetical protein